MLREPNRTCDSMRSSMPTGNRDLPLALSQSRRIPWRRIAPVLAIYLGLTYLSPFSTPTGRSLFLQALARSCKAATSRLFLGAPAYRVRRRRRECAMSRFFSQAPARSCLENPPMSGDANGRHRPSPNGLKYISPIYLGRGNEALVYQR